MVSTLKLNNGYNIPIFGLGTWKSKPGEVAASVSDAIDMGYRLIDGALCYQNEKEVGAGIQSRIEAGVVTRDQLFVTSKLWGTHHRPDLVVPALRGTLSDLGLDYLDLYLIHWPMALKEEQDTLFPTDPNNPEQAYYSPVDLLDTWKAMEECVRLGLTKSIGVSNFNSVQIQTILDNSTVKPVTNQVECHPWLNQRKLNDFCNSRDIVLTGYSPLGSPDRPWATPSDPKLLDDSRLGDLAKKYGKSPAQVVLRWATQRGIVTIPKTVTKSRLMENISIFDFDLAEKDMNYLYTLEKPDGYGRGCAEGWCKTHKDYPFNIEF